MNTAVIHLKTKKDLKRKVERLAEDLGLTLTGLINLNLSQLVESSELVIALRPKPNQKTTKRLLRLKQEADAGTNLSPTFTTAEDAVAWLRS